MRMVQKGVWGLTKASFRRKRSYSRCGKFDRFRSRVCIGTRTECQSTNMSTSKGFHSSLMSPASSTHTNLSQEDRLLSPSDPLALRITPSSFTLIGGRSPRNELCHGEPILFPLSVERSVSSTSLQSKVAPESLLESLPPSPKILRISRTDFECMVSVLTQYRRHVERIASREQRTNT
jgi:hypothetical protein